MADKRVMTTIRLPEDLLEWLRKFSEANHISNTKVIEDFLTAQREGRLLIRPRSGPSAFPREDVEPGSTPDYPILIAPGLPFPPAEDPDQAEGEQLIGDTPRCT